VVYGADWTTTLPALAASGFGKTDFEGYVNFDDANAQYKFHLKNTSFDGDYGNALVLMELLLDYCKLENLMLVTSA
jgi:hypothetical protein